MRLLRRRPPRGNRGGRRAVSDRGRRRSGGVSRGRLRKPARRANRRDPARQAQVAAPSPREIRSVADRGRPAATSVDAAPSAAGTAVAAVAKRHPAAPDPPAARVARRVRRARGAAVLPRGPSRKHRRVRAQQSAFACRRLEMRWRDRRPASELAFRHTHNRNRLIERLGFKSPQQVRQELPALGAAP